MRQSPSYTKRGPGRRHNQGKGGKPAHRTFSDDLMRVWAERRAQESAAKAMKRQLRRMEA